MNSAPRPASTHPTIGRVILARQSRRSSLLSMTTTVTSFSNASSLELGIGSSGGAQSVEARGLQSRSQCASDHAQCPRQVEELEAIGRRATQQPVDDLVDESLTGVRQR